MRYNNMKNFLNIINEYQKKLIIEADAPPPPDAAPTDEATPDAAAAPAAEPPKEEEKVDIPASVVTLSRMLKSSILMNISPEDEDYIRKLPEINQKNATEVVDKIIPIMTKYAPLDIKTNAGIIDVP